MRALLEMRVLYEGGPYMRKYGIYQTFGRNPKFDRDLLEKDLIDEIRPWLNYVPRDIHMQFNEERIPSVQQKVKKENITKIEKKIDKDRV